MADKMKTPKHDKTAWKKDANRSEMKLIKKKLKLTTPDLQKVLESVACGKAWFPDVEQKFWEDILKKLIVWAESCGQSADLYKHWLATREVAPYLANSLTLTP